MTVAIALYLPMGRLAEEMGRRPLVAATFAAFALFPLAVRLAGSTGALTLAFLLGGLKEMGEPARKSLIVDLAPAEARARTVGAYYTVRNLVMVPAGVVGGVLWNVRPALALEVGGAVASLGLLAFLVPARARGARPAW
jgi:MFS family permease